MNYLGQLLQEARIARAMSFGDLAHICGATTPRQTSRIAQRLVLFEREGVRDRKLLQKVIAALDLDPQLVVELLEREQVEELEAWNRWADQPVEIELHVRPFAGFWYRHPLPEDIAADELRTMAYAKQMTAEHEEMRVAVVLDRRRSVTVSRGEIVARLETKPNVGLGPHVVIDGRRVIFEAKRS
jgi:hypothetical protein